MSPQIDLTSVKSIIAFTGRAGAGKDTAADFISDTHVPLAFAKPLKDACKILFNFTDEQLYTSHKELVDSRWGKSPREILQFLGTDVLRKHITDDFFIVSMKQRIESIIKGDGVVKGVVITDVRFDNEAKLIRDMGGIIIKITRDSGSETSHSNHITEKGISEQFIDHTIINNGSLDEFKTKVNFITN